MYPKLLKLRKVSIVATIVFVLLLSGCSKPNTSPTPTLSNPLPRSPVAIAIEIDTSPLYTLGHTVALAIAYKIDELATRINSQGLVIFVCRISSQSWQDCPVSFQTPAIPAWVLPPPDLTAHCGSDPFACSKLKQQYKKDLAAWKIVHASQVRALEQTRAYVHTLTDKIRTMKFQYDDKGSDIWNAVATGASNLQGINSLLKYLILATDFISTTQERGSFSLAGVHVVSIFRTCSDNGVCQHSNSYWSHIVRRAGAISFTSYSVPQSQALGLELPN